LESRNNSAKSPLEDICYPLASRQCERRVFDIWQFRSSTTGLLRRLLHRFQGREHFKTLNECTLEAKLSNTPLSWLKIESLLLAALCGQAEGGQQSSFPHQPSTIFNVQAQSNYSHPTRPPRISIFFTLEIDKRRAETSSYDQASCNVPSTSLFRLSHRLRLTSTVPPSGTHL
jgi:hypothetical protein